MTGHRPHGRALSDSRFPGVERDVNPRNLMTGTCNALRVSTECGPDLCPEQSVIRPPCDGFRGGRHGFRRPEYGAPGAADPCGTRPRAAGTGAGAAWASLTYAPHTSPYDADADKGNQR
ncbi:hypothetical protein GCM10020227_30490 [Streptomyces flavovirens]